MPAYGPTLLFGLGDGAILPVIPLFARDLGASVPAAAAVVTLMYVGSLLFNVPASIITDRLGERTALVGAALTGTLACLMSALAPNLAVLAGSTVLLGFAQSVFMLARQKYLTEAVPTRFRARALSTLGGVMRIGLFAGPFLGAAAIHFAGLRSAYVVCAVALFGAGALSMLLPDLISHSASRSAQRVTVRGVLHDHRRTFLTVGMGVLMVAAVRASRQTVIPLWADEIGMSAQAASVAYGLAGAFDMVVFYPAGKVMDLYGRRFVTVPCMITMGLALLAIPFTSTAVAFGIAVCVLGFGNGIGSGMIMTLGADFSPDVGRSQFLGVWRVLSDLGAVTGPALLSAITAAASLGIAIGVSGGLALVAALVLAGSVPSKH